MKKLGFVALLIVVCCMFVMGGCSVGKPKTQLLEHNGYEIIDYQGNTVKMAGKPQRIISLTLGTDEMLLSLVTPSRLAALTYLADDRGVSNVVESAKQVSGRVKANLESIIVLKPDLVIVADWQPTELIKSIKDAGIPVYVYKTPRTIVEIKQVITEIASLVSEENKGNELVINMDKELAITAEKIKSSATTKKPIVMRYTLMGATYGSGSLFDDMCKYAGVENGVSLAGSKTFEYLPKEKIVAVNPDVLILPAWDFNGKTDVNNFKNDVRNDFAFQSLNAVKNDKLVMVSDKTISATSQYITLGVQDIVTAVYP